MGLYVNQQDRRSELQQRLDADLRAKLAEQKRQDSDKPDGVSDSAYVEGTKPTTTLAFVWLLIAIAAITVLGFFICQMSRGQ